MGSNLNLYINQKFNAEDVVTLLNNLGYKAKLERTNDINMHRIIIEKSDEYNGGNLIFFNNVEHATQIWNCIHGMIRQDSIDLCKTIGERLGGLFQENDCGDDTTYKLESYHGHLANNDGLQYFLKYSVIQGKNKYSIKQLNQTMIDWNKRYNINNNKKYEMFEESV